MILCLPLLLKKLCEIIKTMQLLTNKAALVVGLALSTAPLMQLQWLWAGTA